ncbi:MAG: hypothetical protein AAGD04_03440 [Pseudomonadota bacterium]
MRKWFKVLNVPAVVGAAFTLFFVGTTPTVAPAQGYSVYFADAPLSLALSVVERDLGVEFSVEGSQRHRIKNLSISGSPNDVIAALMEETGHSSFEFNGQIFVSPSDEREVRLIRLQEINAEMAVSALDEAGLILDDFDITQVANGKALVVSGPVKYLAIAESVIASVVVEPESVEPPVRVRRGGRLDAEDGLSISAQTTVQEP